MENGTVKKAVKPTKDQVKEWLKRDIAAASYGLRVMLRYPELLDKFAEEIFDKMEAEDQDSQLERELKVDAKEAKS